MRSENWKRAAKIAENKFEELSGFWSGQRGMRGTSMFSYDAWFSF
jgi:hypothetical protein